MWMVRKAADSRHVTEISVSSFTCRRFDVSGRNGWTREQ